MTTIQNPYKEIEDRFKTVSLLSSIAEHMEWDRDALMMPEGASDFRGDQMACLYTEIQKIYLKEDFKDLFAAAEKQDGLSEEEKVNLGICKKKWVHAAGLSEDLVGKLGKATTASLNEWPKAKENGTFGTWLPYFQKVVELTREKAESKAKALNLSPYDALLDEYQPGFIQKDIEPLFDELKKALPVLVKKIQEKGVTPFEFKADYPQEKQEELNRKIASSMGMDFNRGRMDTSVHPFASGNGDDVRITYKYQEKEPLAMIMGVIHETGHALYGQNLPKEWRDQPIGRDGGMGAHESQSLIWEQQMALSDEFLTYLSKEMKETFGHDELTPENVKKAAGNVKPSFIRIEADEVTYPLHVIFRYELERDMVNGKLNPENLPAAWNQKTHKYLGIVPPNDSKGCLQDVHWPSGLIGYFPSYAIGAVAAAQLAHAMKKQNPDIMKSVEKGDLLPVKEWLSENVHSQGSKVPFSQLIEQVTGEKLTAKYFIQNLENRYLGTDKGKNKDKDNTAALQQAVRARGASK